MLKRILLGSVAALVLGYTGSALADVDVTATINKTKDISVAEQITIRKAFTISVDIVLSPVKAAEVDSLINQENNNNRSCANCDEKLDLISNSLNNNAGIATANQASGNNNNQGSVLTAAVDAFPDQPPPPPPPPGNGETPAGGGFAEAQAAVDQKNGVVLDQQGVRVPASNLVDTTLVSFREDHIIGSINNNLGLVMANQAAGLMMNQANNVAVAIALNAGGVALSEADLGQETSFNTASESDVNKGNTIEQSMNGNRGVTLVNQGTGNMGNQANVLSLSAVSIVGSL